MKDKYKKENLELVVKKSNTLTDVINNLGLRTAGGNYSTINKYIEKYSIDTSHFISEEERLSGFRNHLNKIRKKTCNILVTGSTYNRNNLKKRLISEGLLEYKCSMNGCGNIGKHNGKPLTLQLDHINGIYNDNRLTNLRFLCPNCHSQTPTFAGKSLKKDKGRGGEKWKEHIIKKRKIDRPSYDELKLEVKRNGYSATGRKYGVSDNAIRKWIQYYEKYENC